MASNRDAENFFELAEPPNDGISKVLFFNNSNKCIVSSWDCTVSAHELICSDSDSNSSSDNNNNENNLNSTKKLFEYKHEAGVLDVALTQDDSTIFSAGCDFALRSFDTERGTLNLNINNNNNNNNNTKNSTLIGYHTLPIRCVEYANDENIIITGSWDKTIKLWDARQGNSNNNNNNKALISSHTVSDKVFSMSMQQNNGKYLIIGTADRQVYIYDIRDMSEAIQQRESSLKHQTRTVVWHPNNLQYVLSSIEGRVAVEYLNTNKESQNKKYAFKCHRQNINETKMQTIFPVNCVSFHPIYYTFGTGGGDGIVNIWDGENKKRICQFPTVNTSVASIDFNYNGNIIAIAKSYTWEKGDLNGLNENIEKEKDNIVFRKVNDTQVKPKLKKKKINQ